MAEMTTVVVHVSSHDGRAIADALVVVEEGTAPYPEMAHVTGAEGGVRLVLPAGRFRIGVTDTATGHTSSTAVTTQPGDPAEVYVVI